MTAPAPRMLLTADEARSLTDEIKADVTALLPKIKRAFEGRADVALGYGNWLDYCDTELRGLRLPVDQRRAAVAELGQAGMPSRAIGAALGISHMTAQRDLDATGTKVPDGKVISLDGRERPATRPWSEVKPVVLDPKPPAWDPEERRQHEEQVRVAQDIDSARRGAGTLVTDVRALIFTVLQGSRLGARDLITPDMIADLRRAIDLLEGEISNEG